MKIKKLILAILLVIMFPVALLIATFLIALKKAEEILLEIIDNSINN